MGAVLAVGLLIVAVPMTAVALGRRSRRTVEVVEHVEVVEVVEIPLDTAEANPAVPDRLTAAT
jgi:hypothetical protein